MLGSSCAPSYCTLLKATTDGGFLSPCQLTPGDTLSVRFATTAGYAYDFGTGTAALPATLDVITDGGARGER